MLPHFYHKALDKNVAAFIKVLDKVVKIWIKAIYLSIRFGTIIQSTYSTTMDGRKFAY